MDIDLKVSYLIHSTTRNWKTNVLKDLFPQRDVNLIRRNRPLTTPKDTFCWAETKNGIYFVKSGHSLPSRKKHKEFYQIAEAQLSLTPLMEKCWKLKTAPKIRVFLWKILNGALPVAKRLQTRGLRIVDGCMFCGIREESINHIVFQCPLVRQSWAMSNVPSPPTGFGSFVFDHLCHIFQFNSNEKLPEEIRNVSP